jgi:hypothetical protein
MKYYHYILILLLLPVSLNAQVPYLDFPIDTVVSDEFYNYRAYIKYDSAGKIHMVNSRSLGSNSFSREVFYWNNISGSMIPYRVTNNNVDDNYITFGFDQNGKVHLGWERRDAANVFQLIYTNNRDVGTGFGDSVWITTGGIMKATPYMAVGKNDSSVHFVYYTNQVGSYFSWYRKYNYITETLGSEINLGPGQPSGENDIEIAVDSFGKLHIVYSTNHNFGSGTLKYFNNESGNLSEYSTGVSDLISYPEITIDNNDVLHVIYRRAGGDNRIHYVKRPSGGNFTAPVAITPVVGLPTFWRGIDTDDLGRLFVSYVNNQSAYPRGAFLVHVKDEVISEPILVFEDSTSTYTGRGSNSVTARGDAQIAVHFEATLLRSGIVASDIFIKEGTLIITGINSSNEVMLTDYKLYDNFPNPFNPQTSISFYLPNGGNVKLKVFDILGNEIATLIDGYKSPGIHSVIFDAGNLSSGVYFCKIEARQAGSLTGSFSDTKRMLLVK